MNQLCHREKTLNFARVFGPGLVIWSNLEYFDLYMVKKRSVFYKG